MALTLGEVLVENDGWHLACTDCGELHHFVGIETDGDAAMAETMLDLLEQRPCDACGEFARALVPLKPAECSDCREFMAELMGRL